MNEKPEKKADIAQKKTKNNRFVDERSGGYMESWYQFGTECKCNETKILQPPLTPPVVLLSY